MVELGLEALDFFEAFDELGACFIAMEIDYILRCCGEVLGLHEIAEILHRGLEFLDDDWGCIDEPDFAGHVGLHAGE